MKASIVACVALYLQIWCSKLCLQALAPWNLRESLVQTTSQVCGRSQTFLSILSLQRHPSFTRDLGLFKMKTLFLLFTLLIFLLPFMEAVCPCVCRTNSPKLVNFCRGQDFECRLVRCNPRSLGYACCDPSTTPDRPPTLNEALRNLNILDRDAKAAVQRAPVLTRQLANLVSRCEKQVSRLPSASVRLGLILRMGKSKRNPFKTFRRGTKFALQYIFSSLTKHLK